MFANGVCAMHAFMQANFYYMRLEFKRGFEHFLIKILNNKVVIF